MRILQRPGSDAGKRIDLVQKPVETVIAVDAMGSDRHPRPEIEGALLAARNYGVRVLLVGPEERLRKELAGHPTARNLPIDVVNATQVIEMEEKAVQAVRTKKDSSMHDLFFHFNDLRGVHYVNGK